MKTIIRNIKMCSLQLKQGKGGIYSIKYIYQKRIKLTKIKHSSQGVRKKEQKIIHIKGKGKEIKGGKKQKLMNHKIKKKLIL